MGSALSSSCCQNDTDLCLKTLEAKHFTSSATQPEPEQEEPIDAEVTLMTWPKGAAKEDRPSSESASSECSTEADSQAAVHVSATEQEPCTRGQEHPFQQGRRERIAQGATDAVIAVVDGYATFRESETGQRVVDGASTAVETASAFMKGFKDAIKDTHTGAQASSNVQVNVSSLQQTSAGRAVARGATDVFGAVKAGFKRATKAVDGSEYDVVFDKSTGKKLGVTIDTASLCITSEIGEGLVKDWNDGDSSNPQVASGHCLVEVNGIRNKTALLAELQQNKILEVKLSKPKELIEVEVVLDKASKDSRLGVTLTGKKHPIIKSVACDGLAHGKLQVGDQILSMNGWKTTTHIETTERMKQLEGILRIQVLREA